MFKTVSKKESPIIRIGGIRDIKAYYPKIYKKLTVDNFIVTTNAGSQGALVGGWYQWGHPSCGTPGFGMSKSYNSATGQLSVSSWSDCGYTGNGSGHGNSHVNFGGGGVSVTIVMPRSKKY